MREARERIERLIAFYSKEPKGIAINEDVAGDLDEILSEMQKEEPSVPIDENFESMMISALRYALGRKSYIVSTTIDYITPILPSLSDATIACMLNDVDEKFNMCDALGMEQDRNEWAMFYQGLSKEKWSRK